MSFDPILRRTLDELKFERAKIERAILAIEGLLSEEIDSEPQDVREVRLSEMTLRMKDEDKFITTVKNILLNGPRRIEPLAIELQGRGFRVNPTALHILLSHRTGDFQYSGKGWWALKPQQTVLGPQ